LGSCDAVALDAEDVGFESIAFKALYIASSSAVSFESFDLVDWTLEAGSSDAPGFCAEEVKIEEVGAGFGAEEVEADDAAAGLGAEGVEDTGFVEA
jgi:hypothetical protein